MMTFSARTFRFLLLGIVVEASVTNSLAQQGHSSTPAPSSIDERFYAQLARAAASTDLEKTRKSGGKGGGAFAEVRLEGGLLVGLEAWEGDWAGHRIIRGLRPVFQTAAGRVRGQMQGTATGQAKVAEAREGYAVPALEVRGGDRLDGFQILFWKIRPSMGRLDAEGTYKSEWIGGGGGGKARHALGSDGRLVLGIYGASGSDIDKLGLIYVPR